jgi:UDP-3-O-[3-hydroxymyristoyl] N-acetylglucosamine deacetylase
MDLGSVSIPVREADIVSTVYSTTIGIDGVRVQTVEHLLAALSALEIDNLFVELTGEEVPIADGSATPFINLILEAGIIEQAALREVTTLTEPLTLTDDTRTTWITLPPAASLQISYTIEFDHPLISRQSYTSRHSPDAFIKEIASARTFGFLSDVKRLLENGLARGGSLENAIVVGEDKILNEGGLRFDNEFVRHKILDLVGDLALLGTPILGRIEAHHAGHLLHTRLIEALRKRNQDKSLLPTKSQETFQSVLARTLLSVS